MNQPTSTLRALLLPALALLLALPATAQGTRVYKWQDEHGNVHYSDRLPASQMASNRQVLNRDGVRIRELDPPPPVAQETAAERQEVLRSARRDHALANSFNNENELRRVHEEQLGLIRSSLALARGNADKLEASLADQQDHLDSLGSQRVPLQIQERVEHTRRMLEEQNNEIVRLEARYDTLLLQQSQELRRYRELAGAP